AAFAVFLNHCFPLTGQPEPFGDVLGMTVGTWAVDIFFITSGFLVTQSLIRSDSARIYLLSRAIRIYPALIVAVFITTFGLGMWLTRLSVSEYLSHPLTWSYLLKGSTLLGGIGMQLPGVFEQTPFPDAVNGSLWTLIYEVKMYLALLLMWALTRRWHQNDPCSRILSALVLALVVAGWAYFFVRFAQGREESHLNRLGSMFFTGAAFYFLRQYIVLKNWLAILSAALLVVSAFVSATAFTVVYVLTVPYLLFWAAYIPSGKIRLFNRAGDYSYGIYIYAFPVQQVLVSLFPGMSAPVMMLTGTVVIIPIAILSWHAVEKRALAYKSRFNLSARRKSAKTALENQRPA
uniref:acyltransferase family protein n=1 Tax=Undibacterium luofuense TaxID=2828733 RepID=UPI0030ECE4A1